MPGSADLLVIGLGHVGLPLAREAAFAGLTVIGYDLNTEMAAALNAGRSHVGDVPDADVADMLRRGFRATSIQEEMGDPTPWSSACPRRCRLTVRPTTPVTTWTVSRVPPASSRHPRPRPGAQYGNALTCAKVVYALPLLAATAVLAACTSSSSTSSNTTAVSTSRPATSAEMATEVITASTANVDASSMTVKASGTFTDTGTLKLPIGNPRTITFKFTRGNLVVLNATGPADGPRQLNKATCAFSQSSDGTYRILSGNSTGSYAGATGHGVYAFDSSGIVPKAPGGTCETGSGATPAKAHFTIRFSGPLILNERN